MALPLPASVPLVADDLEGMPDDGRRYELIDGCLVVTPAPGLPHQRVVGALYYLLRAACPPGLEVFVAPVDFVPQPSTVLQPDILAARAEDAAGQRLTRPPLLVVEVLSPCSRAQDLGSKRLAYAEAVIPWYWVVDPDAPGSLVVHRLEAGTYSEVARASGEEAHASEQPFAVTVVPARLLDRPS